MGNAALEIFADITEDGNRWKEVALPKHADVLSRDQQGWDGSSSPSRAVPRLLVAPAAPAARADGVAACDASLADRFGTMKDDRQPVFQHFNSSGSLTSVGGRTFDASQRPSQVVLQPGAAADRGSGLRPSSRFCWRPLDQCPALRKHGTLLTEARLRELRPHLPVGTRLASCWKLIYSPSIHGISLRTFYRQCQSWPGETLLLVEDTDGFVFGCFASHTWQLARQHSHFGDADCFVFSFGPAGENRALAVHPWAGGNMYFMYAGQKGFSMGGGAANALFVNSDFLTGSSSASATFGTPAPLSSQEEFVIRRLECWAFDHTTAAVAAQGFDNPHDQWAGVGSGGGRPPHDSPSNNSGCELEDSPVTRCAGLRESASDMIRFRFG